MFLRLFSFIGDRTIPKAVSLFIQEYGTDIVQRNLCRNALVHLANLCDFGLLKPESLRTAAVQLLRLRAKVYSDGLLALNGDKPVEVNRKWDPLRNFEAVPVCQKGSVDFVELVAAAGVRSKTS